MGTCFRIHNDWNQTRINSITLELTFIDSDVYAVLRIYIKAHKKTNKNTLLSWYQYL